LFFRLDKDLNSERLEYWNSRSKMGLEAGTPDVNLKHLEIKKILELLPETGFILDAGCGNAYTLCEIIKKKNGIKAFGFDYSPNMIRNGIEEVKLNGFEDHITLFNADIINSSFDRFDIPELRNGFDCIYTERSIINLNNFKEQKYAIERLWKLLKVNGKLILCESFFDGLDQINHFRNSIDLPSINPPWHNRYLRINELEKLSLSDSKLEIIEFSGSYYFVSRVVNAFNAKHQSITPSYDDHLNIMSLDLPNLNICGQAKIALFTKMS